MHPEQEPQRPAAQQRTAEAELYPEVQRVRDMLIAVQLIFTLYFNHIYHGISIIDASDWIPNTFHQNHPPL